MPLLFTCSLLLFTSAANAAELPTGYRQVESIESTAGVGQYIDTRYRPTVNTRIVADFDSMTRSQEWGVFFGVTGCDNSKTGILLRYHGNSNDLNAWFCNEHPEATRTSDLAGKRLAVELKKGSLMVDGTSYSILTRYSPYDGEIFIFCGNSGDKPWRHQAMRLYSFKIYEWGTPKRDFVPCVEMTTNKAGLWDRVEGKFYSNAGSGEFHWRPLQGGTAVEYIESTKGGGQYINTGYVPTLDTRIEADFNPLAKGDDWLTFFGAASGEDPSTGVLLRYSDSSDINGWFCNDSTAAARFAGLENTRITAELNAGDITLNGQTAQISTSGTPYNGPIYIFCGNTNGTACRHHAMRLYSFRIFEGDDLKRDFVPCVSASGQAGLYDTVERKFYGNAGSGTFLRPLPKDYTAVEYIESTKDGGQWIDTGYIHKANTKIECSVSVASKQAQGYPVIFGSYNGDFRRNAFAFFAKFLPEIYGENTPPALGHTGHEQVGEPNSFPYDTRVDLVCEETQASWRRFGETSVCGSISNTGTAADDGVWPMNIFVNNNNGAQSGNTWCAMKLYSFRIYEGETPVRDFVPCVETATGKAGLYDVVEGKFYSNKGGDLFRYPDCPNFTGITQANVGNHRTLRNGNTYWFVEHVDFTAAATESALRVENGATVEIVVPKNIKVKLTGGAANGTTGGGAGIEVPANAKLVIRGAGELSATGGRGANGGNGGQGVCGYQSSITLSRATSGGKGGSSGGGAGAGIGGKGGSGQAEGGAGGAAFEDKYDNKRAGNYGAKGGDGGPGGDCGTVEIRETVTVTALGGAAGANGAGGKGVDWTVLQDGWWYRASYGGGGGGGGGGGCSGASIGGGGGGGGAGGGGGGSGLSYAHQCKNIITYSKNGSGGSGGHGDGTSVGGKGEDRILQTITYNGTTGLTESQYDKPGYGGGSNGGGAAGKQGGSGSVTAAATVNLNWGETYDVGKISDTERIRWENGKLVRIKDGQRAELTYELLTASTDTLGDDRWYVVQGAVKRLGGVDVRWGQTANIVLLNHALLTLDPREDTTWGGITVKAGCALNIFGGPGGVLTATSYTSAATIGGTFDRGCGTVTIYGGTVTARGGFGAAAIGECRGHKNRIVPIEQRGHIIINGGTVTAQGGSYAAGIGAGYEGCGCRVTINGGTVTATGGKDAEGIYGGSWSPDVGTLNGGTITVWGGENGAPLGGRWKFGPLVRKIDDNHYQEVEPIVVSIPLPPYLHLVSATDWKGNELQVSVQDGVASFRAAAIPRVTLVFDFAQPEYRFTSPNVITVGPFDESVTLPSTILPQVRRVALSLSLPDSLRLSAVAENGTPVGIMTVGGVVYVSTFPNAGRVTLSFSPSDVGYRITGNNMITVDPIDEDATLPADKIPRVEEDVIEGAVEYLLADGSVASTTGVRRINQAVSLQDTLASGWYMATGDLKTSVLNVQGTVNLILADGATLTVNGGIRIDQGNALNIYCQHEETGKLIANGGNGRAGIGGGDQVMAGGTVTINGGTVTAQGGNGAPGIGGGDHAAGGTVTVNGGTVTANGGENSAGIGGGDHAAGGAVTVNGGTVTAQGGKYGAGVGGGYCGAGGTVTVNGGTVTATGGSQSAGIGGGKKGAGGTVTINGGLVTVHGRDYGAGIGNGDDGGPGNTRINGGTVMVESGRSGWGDRPFGKSDSTAVIAGGNVMALRYFDNPTVTDGRGAKTYCVTVKCPDLEGLLSLEGLEDYGTRDIRPLDGKVCLWLPNGVYRFTISDGRKSYRCYVKVEGREVTIEPPPTYGFLVNGADIGDKSGDGWAYDGSVLSLTNAQTYVLSGAAMSNDVQVKVAQTGATVVLSNAVVFTEGRVALDVTRSAALLMAGGASYLAATNESAAVSVAQNATLTVGLAPGANGAESMIGVFNYGNAKAIFALDKVLVNSGTLAVWADMQAVISPDNLTWGDAEMMKTGESPETMRYADFYASEPCVLVAPAVTVTVKDIPHITDFTVSNAVEELDGNPIEGGTAYRVMLGDDVFVGYTLEEGYTSKSANPLVYSGVESDITVDAGSIEIVPPIPYRAWNETTRQMEDRECADYTVVTAETTEFESDKWYVVTNTVSRGKITVRGPAHLILCDGATLTADGDQYEPGIEVRGENSLHIYGQSGGTGALAANGGHGGAGIGGGDGGGAAGTVTIDGGTVTATGGENGAGIGGGYDDAGGAVTINGGIVTAWGGHSGAGIGGGDRGAGGAVTINGGRVTAIGKAGGKGVGGGSSAGGGTVCVNGGTIDADGWNGQGLGGTVTIDGGSVKTKSYESQPKSGAGAPLYRVTAKCEGLEGLVGLEGLESYGTNDIYAVEGKVYLYLPDGMHRFSISDGTTTYRYCAIVKGRGITVEPLAPVGFFVNGVDIGETAEGEGWTYDRGNRILGLNAVGPYALSGAATNDEVQVMVAQDGATVVLSNTVVFTESRPALVVNGNASLLMAGGASFLGATNESAAVTVAAGAALAVGLAPGADETETMIGVFNYGNAKAISGAGAVSVSNGTFFVWADEQAVEKPDAFTCGAGEVLMTGETPETLRYATSCSNAPCALVLPGVTVTVKDIPHITDFTVSSMGQEIGGTPVEGGTEYRVLSGEDVDVGYALEDGYASKSANPLVYTNVTNDITVDAGSIQIVPTIPYLAWNAETQQMEDRVCTNYTVVAAGTTAFEDDEWYVVTNDIICGAITVDNSAHLILCDGATLTMVALTGGSLAVYGQTGNSGALVSGTVGTVLTVVGGNVTAGVVTASVKNAMGEVVHCVTCGGLEALEGVEGLAVAGLENYGITGARLIDGKVYLWLPNGTHYFTIYPDETAYYCYCAEVDGTDITVSPAPPPEPVTPGKASGTYTTAEAATNAANRAVLVPTDEVLEALDEEDEAVMTYCDRFGFAVTGGGTAWSVKAVLTPEAESSVTESASQATRQIPLTDIAALPTDGKKDVSVTNCVPGFYYTLFGAAGVRVLPTTETKYETKPCGVSGEVTFPEVQKPSDAAGFFSIGVKETPGVTLSDRLL